VGEGVKQANHAGVGGRDSENKRTGDGKRDHESNQQTSQVRPTFPSIQLRQPTVLISNALDALVRSTNLPALTLPAVYN
jgi:hypothetical protein